MKIRSLKDKLIIVMLYLMKDHQDPLYQFDSTPTGFICKAQDGLVSNLFCS